MAIIPADKPDAAWNVGETLSDLLFWAIHPSPKPLSDAWLDSYKDKLASATDAASRSFADDPATLQKLSTVRRLGFAFGRLLCDRPKLSTISREAWTVPMYQRLFDELDGLQTHFRDAGKEAITPAKVIDQTEGEQPAASTPAAGDKPKRATINARMMDMLDKRPESKDWTVSQFVQALGCRSKSSVGESRVWKRLQEMRAAEADHRRDRDLFLDVRGKKRNRTK